MGEVTWYCSRYDSLLPGLWASSACIVPTAASMVVSKTLPTANEAGTRASVRGVGVPSLKVSATRDCSGVEGSATLDR